MAITLTTVQAVLDKASPYANSTITASEAIVERYIEEAEGTVIGLTRINWITDFSQINTSVKDMLSLCVSSLAAKNIVSYDMAGFSPITAAVTNLNANELNYQATLKQLKDLDTNKVRSVPS